MMRHLALLIVLALVAPFSFAAQVAKVKGSSALVNMGGESTLPGDTYFALQDGRKKAILRIVKVKGEKAIAKVLKGTAAPGMTLQRRGGSSGGAKTSTASRSNGNNSRGSSNSAAGGPIKGRSYWGGMFGLAQDSMSVNVNSATLTGTSLGTVALSGIGFSGHGLFDYELFDQVWFRGLGGLEQFNVAGSANCGTNNAEACNAKIIYLSMDFIGRYVFAMGEYRPWLGAGVGLLFPASKSATALESPSIGTTNVLLVTGGLDYFLSPSMYIPISLEYGILPKSSEVDAHWVEFRAGVAVPF